MHNLLREFKACQCLAVCIQLSIILSQAILILGKLLLDFAWQLRKEGRRNVYEMHKLQALHQRQKMVSPFTLTGMACCVVME
jgi:hypothetical protein